MAERPTYKLRFLDPKKRFPTMPEQPAGRSYGVVWKVFGEDPKESCYVVEFVGKSHISLLGYVSVSGKVYKVDRPVREAPLPEDPDMELVLHESDSSIGEIMVREANGAMRVCARTAGSPEGPMREQSDHETWNSTRALPYGEFMASMFLRYVIFANSESASANTAGVDGLDADMQNVVDKIKLVKLPEPVEAFLGFDTAPLPDAIETLLYRVDHAENPSGIERYAAALMSEVDLPHLRTIAAKSEMSLAHIDRSKLFYLNFDRSLLDQDEIDMLLAIECRLNRLSGILERIGAGLVPAASSPSLEGCALFDASLRQPIEEKQVIISRLNGTFRYPADCLLVAAMNPCPCGYFPDRNKCQCTESQIRQYQRGISKPILERIDLCVEASPVAFADAVSKDSGPSSSELRAQVLRAREIQTARFRGESKIRVNAEMGIREIERYCTLGSKELAFIGRIFQLRSMSMRTYHKVLKVARTIADLEEEEQIRVAHLSEAVNYRGIEDQLYGTGGKP